MYSLTVCILQGTIDSLAANPVQGKYKPCVVYNKAWPTHLISDQLIIYLSLLMSLLLAHMEPCLALASFVKGLSRLQVCGYTYLGFGTRLHLRISYDTFIIDPMASRYLKTV